MKHLKVYESLTSEAGKVNEAAINMAAIQKKMSTISKKVDEISSNAKRMVDGDATAEEQSAMSSIIDCIKSNNLEHLMFLTTGSGAYALGMVTALTLGGVTAMAGVALGFSGMCMIILDAALGEATDTSVVDEIASLQKCLEKKGIL